MKETRPYFPSTSKKPVTPEVKEKVKKILDEPVKEPKTEK